MADTSDETMATKVALLITTAAGAWIARKLITKVWQSVSGNDAPHDPLNNESTLAGVVAFGALAGAATALSRILASKGAKKITRRVEAAR